MISIETFPSTRSDHPVPIGEKDQEPLLVGAATDGWFGIVRAANLGYLIATVGYALLTPESRPMVYAGLTLIVRGTGEAKLAPQSLAPRLFPAEPESHDQ